MMYTPGYLSQQEIKIIRDQIREKGIQCWQCSNWDDQNPGTPSCKISSPSFPNPDFCYEENPLVEDQKR